MTTSPKATIFWTSLFFIGVSLLAGSAAGQSPDVITLEDFSQFQVGAFPDTWQCLWTQKGAAKKIYAVQADEKGKYLRARAVNCSVPIAKKVQCDLKVYPFLSWQWRVNELPTGGDERYKKTGDSAAAIYVIFPGWIRPANIKYVWSASLPVGTVTDSPYSSKTKVVVLRNQSTPLGTWVREKVNVYQDFQRLFGQEPEPVKAFGIMTDSDNTKSTAEGDYGALYIKKR